MTARAQGPLLASAIGWLAACGTSSPAADGGVTGAGGASGGAGGAATGGATGTGGAPPASCPGAAPQAGAACTTSTTCYYEDCTDAGRTVAMCASGAWMVTTAPCGSTICMGMTCPAGQICVESGGGALLVSCVQSTCGTGPISCGCLQSCAGSCSLSGSAQSGFILYCNTCTSNQCA